MIKLFSIVLLFSRDSPFVHECSANFRSLFDGFSSKLPEIQGGHKPGKHGKPLKLRDLKNCQNLWENSGKFEFL